MSKVIGIDLGTTNSVASVMDGASPKIIINSNGGRTTPSVMGLTDKNEILIGQIARNQQVTSPKKTVSSVKRFMGKKSSELSDRDKKVPYDIIYKENNIKIKLTDTEYSPEEISAHILRSLKKDAEDYLGEDVKKAVITVPAYFNDAQRQATKIAGEIAGLEVARIINEPTAAALAYGYEQDKEQKIAVFDFGGGTFDISILDIGDGVIEVLSTNGDTHLGGDDIDLVLVDYIIDSFKKSDGIDLSKDAMAYQRIIGAAEKAKIDLSSSVSTNINLPFITADQNGPKHLSIDITRAKFESLIDPILERLINPCKKALKDASLEEVDDVLFVGGSTRIPKVAEIVENIFNKKPNKSLNPDEVVSLGAAIQGGILAGDTQTKDILLLDVTPLSLGVETLGGICTKVIERNTTIPTSKSQIFSTAENSQSSVDIHVLQGEREFAKDNRTLGRFQLNDIPPAPRGVPQIEVSFNLDANGILNVTAKDLGTNKEQSIEIKSTGTLTDEEIEKMKQDAERYQEEDQKKKKNIEMKNSAVSVITSIEKTIKDNKDKLTEEVIQPVEEEIARLNEYVSKDDYENIEKSLKDLQEKSQEIGKILYEKSANDQEKNTVDSQEDTNT